MSEVARNTFPILRPLCVEISKTPNVKAIKSLSGVLIKLPDDVVDELHEYVLFPLRIVLLHRPKVKEEIAISAIDCMSKIFEKLTLIAWKVFEDLFKMLLGTVAPMNNNKTESDSEELKISVINALTSLIKSMLSTHSKKFYNVNNIPNVGYLVSTSLNWINNEENRKLQIGAIKLLQIICSTIDNHDCIAVTMQGNLISSFLPGILSCLSTTICGDIKLGQNVRCSALKLMTSLLLTCFSDDGLKMLNKEAVKLELSSLKKKIDGRVLSLSVNRDQKWLNVATPKVDMVIQKLLTVTGDLNLSVRLELLNFSHLLLTNCSNTLRQSTGHLLKIPIIYLNDELKKVSSKSREIIDKISLLLAKQNQDIKDVIFDSMFDLCKNLSRNLRKYSDEEKLSSLNLLAGYLQVLSYDFSFLFSSLEHLNKLFNALFFCFKLDTRDLQKIEDVEVLADNFDTDNFSVFQGQLSYWQFHKNFLEFHNDNIIKFLVQICRLLGKYGDIDVIVDILMEHYNSESNGHQCVMILNEVMLGCSEQKSEEIFNNFLDICLADENWYLPTNYESEYLNTHYQKRSKQNMLSIYPLTKEGPTVNSKILNSNIILVCLHLEALSAFSTILKEKFREKLIVALYPVLEKVNDSNYLISSCALLTLRKFASNCGYTNVAALLTLNADYLVSKISIHLRHISLYPRCPVVLQVTLTHSDISIFPLVRDTIDEILTFLDMHGDTKLMTFLPLLLTTVKSINKWFQKTETLRGNVDIEVLIAKKPKISPDEIVNDLLEYKRNLDISNIRLDDEINDDKPENQNQEDLNEYDEMSAQDETKVVLPEVKIIVQIVERCCHLMSNLNPKVRLNVMELICVGISGLSSHENSLLPLVHKLWSPLMERFNDSELQVVSMAFNVIFSMASSCGDFIRRRFSQEIFRKLISFLKMSDEISHQVAAKQTQLFKLKHNLLKNMGAVLKSANIKMVDHQAACESAYLYLSARQPANLQESAVKFFCYLIFLDPDSTWLFLSDIYTPTPVLVPDYENFRTITLAGSSDSQSEFAKNIGYLLTLC